VNIREMKMDDYDFVVALYQKTPGIAFREADSKDAIKRYLNRNPGLSFVAVVDEEIIGCVMCGHDGRRGYLQHLVVTPEYQRQGIGEKLVMHGIEALKSIGIYKTHIFVLKNNRSARNFWLKRGWRSRKDINLYSYNASSNENV
jgi:N-acetylglutamate synthase